MRIDLRRTTREFYELFYVLLVLMTFGVRAGDGHRAAHRSKRGRRTLSANATRVPRR